jgi:anaerobic selenocysteine-containing dehydrogenase
MLIQSTNPASVAPDSTRVRRGLMRDDLFVAVHEHFMTDTARLADLVLPATMFLEHDDIYQAGGHSHIQIGAKVTEPPGECRSNHDLVCDLAKRLGAEHRGFRMTPMEIIDETLKASGWPNAETVMQQRWVDAQPDFDRSHFVSGFGHPDGRFRFRPDWQALGPRGAELPALPDHWESTDPVAPDRPFRLIAPPARQFLNSTFNQMETSIRREHRPTALMHPTDADRLGIADGMLVRLANQRGEVLLHAKLAAGLQPGTVVVEGVWADHAFAGGIGINALTSDEPALPAGGAVFHDTAICVEPAELAQRIAAE